MDDQNELPPALERRMAFRLLHHWREAGGEGGFPRLEDIDRGALADIWPECYVLDVASTPDDPSFHSVGQAFIEQCGTDFTGRPVSELSDNTLLYHSAVQVGRVLEKGVPVSLGGSFENAEGKKILYRSILLPLSDDQENIIQLLGAANSRVVSED